MTNIQYETRKLFVEPNFFQLRHFKIQSVEGSE